MATIIQIKRSSSGNAPATSTLAEAELAYSQDASADGANAILYIESVDSGSNPVIHKIGGKYYTDVVDTATATNTANKLVKRDGAGGFAGNLYGTANVASALNSTYVNNVAPGTGITVSGTHTVAGANLTVNIADTTVSPGSYGGAASIPTIIVDQQGRITFAANNAAAASSFTIRGNTGTDTFNTGDVMDIIGVAPGISTAATDNTISITNTGVTGLTSSGHGIVLSGSSGNISATFTGVGSITGTANEIEVSAGTGNITIGLPNDVTIGNDLTVSGNLSVLGTAITVNSTSISINDPLIHLANNNTSSDVVDIGFEGHYYDATFGDRHAGLFRDASDGGKFKFFANVSAELENVTTIDTENAGFTIATLVANLTGANVSNLLNPIAVADGGSGRSTLTANTIIAGDGTNPVRLVAGTSGQVLQIDGDGQAVFGVLDGGTY